MSGIESTGDCGISDSVDSELFCTLFIKNIIINTKPINNNVPNI